MPKPRTYTDNDFIEAVKTSGSMRQVLKKLGLKEAGGNYECTKNRIDKLNLDISHFHGQLWNKNKKIGPKRPIEEYLQENKNTSSYRLKLRLIEENIKKAKCEWCGITEWNKKPAPLELDHINGNRKDNRLENLRILCPNCHAQTDTYRSKNKK
jgi:hypothetical protein